MQPKHSSWRRSSPRPSPRPRDERAGLRLRSGRCLTILALAVAGHVVAVGVGAQSAGRDSSAAKQPARVVITPGPRYGAGWLHRVMLGEDYRSLWTTPIEVELLDLAAVGGGLRPTERGGSMQTMSLRFTGADGRDYVFRPIEKDFSRLVPEPFRLTLVRSIAQDQVSGFHPGAHLVVARLLDATGIHHPRPRLVVMPDDPKLGEYRADFAGVVGTMEERVGRDFDATPETPGASDAISSERLFARLRKDPHTEVDTRAFLAARLFDILVGDRDRHRDQWRWAQFASGKEAAWEPVPRDRDMAFARFEGLGVMLARGMNPQFVTFARRYPDMVWLNWNAREIDRRLLSGLERAVWDSVARAVQSAITDAVIDSAIAQMPAPFVAKNGRELRGALVARRQQLPRVAGDYYEILAREVDLYGSDARDVAEVTRLDDGSTEVALLARSPSGGSTVESASSVPGPAAYLRRRFVKGETREVRLYLDDGDDRVIIRGADQGGVLVRVIGGDGRDAVTDSVPNGNHAYRVYDASGNDRTAGASPPRVDRSEYTPPKAERPEDPPRDWGTWSFPVYRARFTGGLGLVASAGRTVYRYGFRSYPYASRSTVRLDFSLGELRPRLVYDAEFRGTTPSRFTTVQLTASGIDLIRFHGFGNETPSDRETEYYRVVQNLFRVEPGLKLRVSPAATVSLGIRAQHTATGDDANTLIGQTKPYGGGDFGEVGATVGIVVDRRDVPQAPSRGVHLAAGAGIFPAVWDVERTFGEAHATLSTYASAGGRLAPTLALRAGGQHVWGTFPFHDAAFIGGSTLRGWDDQRFAGRSSAFGSAELRVFLAKLSVVVPADVGILGFSDAGRVFVDGDESDVWHSGFGGGVWAAPLTRNNTVSLTAGRSRERTALYLRTGFVF